MYIIEVLNKWYVEHNYTAIGAFSLNKDINKAKKFTNIEDAQEVVTKLLDGWKANILTMVMKKVN